MKIRRIIYSRTARLLAMFFSVVFASIFVITTFVIVAKENLFYGEDVSKISCYQESKGVKDTLNNSLNDVLGDREAEDKYNQIDKQKTVLEISDYASGSNINYSIRDVERETGYDAVMLSYNTIDVGTYKDSTGRTHSIYNDYNYAMLDFKGTTAWVRIDNESYMNLIKKYTTQNRQKLKKLPQGAVVTERNAETEASTEEIIEESFDMSSFGVSTESEKNDTAETGEKTGAESNTDDTMHSLSTDYSIYNSYDYNQNPKAVIYKNEDRTYDAKINSNFDDNCEIIQSNGKTFLVSYDESVIYSDVMGWVSIKQLESEYFYVPKSYIDYSSTASTDISILFAPTFTSIIPAFFNAIDDYDASVLSEMAYVRYYPNYYVDGVYYCYESSVDGKVDVNTNSDENLDVDIESFSDCSEEIKRNSDVVLMYDSDSGESARCYYETKDGSKVNYDYLNKTNRRKLEEIGEGFKLVIGINIDKNTIVSNYYWYSLVFSLSRLVSHTVPFFVLSFVLFFVCIIVMIINTGSVVDSEGKVSFRIYRFDRIPLELFLATLLATLVFVYNVLVNFIAYHNVVELTSYLQGNRDVNYAILSLLIAASIAAYVVLMEMFLSTVRRIKTRHFWDSFFVVRFFRWIHKKIDGLKLGPNKIMGVLVEGLIYLTATGLLFIAMVYAVRKGDKLFFFTASFGVGLILFVVLYKVLRTVSGIRSILEATKRISEGEIESKVPVEGLDINCRELAENINSIGDGLNDAVNASIRDERMKADLITNVSHDIKTPLTSIINYVALIKREKVENDKVNEYVQVLDQKSQRLKQLIEDLVEASKASSGNLSLECINLDFIELLQQTIGEFDDKFNSRKLSLVTHMPGEPVIIYADGRRCFRIVENLFQNAFKYAMPGTRIYLDVTSDDEFCTMKMKNVSEAPLNISPEELTERFVRGDESRTTEGSGLGLSIAKDLSILQNGTFEIGIDGDMFTVIVTFPVAKILEKTEEDVHNDIEIPKE